MESNMLISIITPAYNPGDLLLGTFQCLEKQTFKNFEWIIVDDNSDDGTSQILDKSGALFFL